MKKLIAALLVLTLVFSLVACGGGSDALKGTWTCEDEFYGTVTWDFNGSGKCSMDNGMFDSKGTYTITGSTVSIKLEIWDEAIEYNFEATETSLKLTNDGLAPNYDLTKK